MQDGVTQILTVNVGSSSVRFAGYEARGDAVRCVRRLRVEDTAQRSLRSILDELHLTQPSVVAHRVVHGGAELVATCEVDARVEAEILRLGALAPLHNPHAAAWIANCRRELPRATQVAVFDTAFFAELPEVAATYALPRALCRKLGVRRYGFHGLAHQALWNAWQRTSMREGTGKLITLQLGSGCSMAAIKDGDPLDTSMGMTPLEGLVMATRCGDLDPGVVSYLLRQEQLSPRELDELLNERSGLKGVSGTSGDVRTLLGSAEPEASLALELYCHRARKYVGAYLSVLDGADALAFGGGVGEHEPEIRRRISDGAAFCGLRLDEAANARGICDGRATLISAADSAIEVWVIPVDEEARLAEEAWALTKGRA
jgi:acetate kinase